MTTSHHHPVKKQTHWKLTLVLVVIALMIGGTGVYINKIRPHLKAELYIPTNLKIDGTVLDPSKKIQAFQMTDSQGKPFTQDNLKGHWTLMFFGFTNCAYVCPTTMSELTKMYVELKKTLPISELPQIVMVSVDPDRDTYQRMNKYVKTFNSDFEGIRGDALQTKGLANQMDVVYERVEAPDTDYTISHSAELMLIDPKGNLRAFFSYPHEADVLVKDYETIMTAIYGNYSPSS